MIFVVLAFVMMTAEVVDVVHEHHDATKGINAEHAPKSMSWDQENLKRNDKGCPTAVYVAPNGNLEQC